MKSVKNITLVPCDLSEPSTCYIFSYTNYKRCSYGEWRENNGSAWFYCDKHQEFISNLLMRKYNEKII